MHFRVGLRSFGNPKMRVAAYTRVSTLKNQDCEVQARELREYCTRRGWKIVAEFSDTGFSGAKDSRPALDKMLRAARRREFDVILVWKLDRLSRSLRHLVNLLSEFESLGLALASLTDAIDFTTPQGKLMFALVSAFGEFERSLIRERIMAGLRAARARGARFGRPPIDVDRQAVAELRASGASWRTIAKRLGVSRATCMRTVPARPKIAAA
jgi:DNA invertase Pin-like site-specific DNA recombinase